MTQSVLQIPVIDFEPFIAGNLTQRQAVAQEIYQACHQIGFLCLKNHSFSFELIDRVFEQAKEFFALPLEVKNCLAWDESNRGYSPMEKQSLDRDRQLGDLKESFDIGREISSDYVNAELEPYYPDWMPQEQRNKWPPDLPQFRSTLLEFQAAAHTAMCSVLQAFAVAMDLPDNFFVNYHRRQNHTVRLVRYPLLNQTPQSEQLGAGSHSDWGSVTLLLQDDRGGLEVCTTTGEWISLPPIPGTIVVNTGDLMQRWTNDEFRSTLHRVVPSAPNTRRDRYSAVFFGFPDYDAEINCISSGRAVNNSTSYSPLSAGDYLLERIRTTFAS